MSVFQKFFIKDRKKSSKLGIFSRKQRQSQSASVIELPSKENKTKEEPSVFVAMPPPDVRLVLFQECGETSDRRSLFDSKSFEPQKLDKDDYTVVASNHQAHGYTKPRSRSYQYVRGPQDMEIISEMLFGTVGMASRASSLKIHIMKNPQRLMLSRVFCVESSKESGSLERGMDSQRPIPVLSRRKAKTLPVPTPESSLPPVPPPIAQTIASSLTSRITRSDSSSSLISLTNHIFGASLGATGSLGSRSVPQQIPPNHSHSLPPATRQASRDSFTLTLTQEPHNGLTSRRTKVKIGFAVIFEPEPSSTSEFQRFFFEHFPLIESYVTFLKEQVESALNNYKKSRMEFNEAMMEALLVFTSRISSVYSTPRLPKPVWSTLSSTMSQTLPWNGDDVTVECFIAELARMVNAHNTKQKNFFMSGLITSVLTHHLGWVNSTLPPSHGERNAQTMAYNPLWAQLGDLYGAVGTPTKVAKTIVIGEIHELVSTIISILSYFIRCSNIEEVVQVPADMTPQAFSRKLSALSMSYVPSELETSDYVFVSLDENSSDTTTDGDSEQESPKQGLETPKAEKKKKLSLCEKLRKHGPVGSDFQKQESEEIDSAETSNGSTLCRSRSTPGSAKPSVKVVNRQKSSGNFESVNGMRLRTNSNDMFTRPRGVQSRRTSQRISQSTSELAIPGAEKLENIGSSLEGSKSLCMATPTPNSGNLKIRARNENMGSCPQNLADTPKTPTPAMVNLQSTKPPMIAPMRSRTHKRVSSEPFNVNKSVVESASLIKTKSTLIQPVRQTFVEHIEPKIVNVAHVQRSQPVIAMQSPVSSPMLSRLDSSGRKGPIMGFKTNETSNPPKPTPRSKHKSGSALQEKPPVSADFRDVFSPQKNDLQNASNDPMKSDSKFDFSGASPTTRRLSSNTSVGSPVRRSSSASSSKMKLASRRRKLTDSKTPSIDEEGTEKPGPHLPPLNRIPSISLKHDDFVEYLDDEPGKSEYIFFSSENHSSGTENQSCMKNSDTPSQSSNTTKKPPPLPSVSPRGDSRIHSTVTESMNQKAENQSCIAKKSPPPLPVVGPCHRSQSMTSKGEKVLPSGAKPTPKSAPPIPAVPPAHHGPLYPRLDLAQTSESTPIVKYSLHPSGTPKETSEAEKLYPKLDGPPPSYESVSAGDSLYPHLPPPSFDSLLNPPLTRHTSEDTFPQNMECFSMHKKVPLCPVERSEVSDKTKENGEGEKMKKLTFGELMADYSPEYLWGFALHGTKNQPGLYRNVIHELQHLVSHPVLDEPVAESVSIVADTDKWTVRVLSSHRIHSDKLALPAMNSKLVTEMLDKIMKLYQMSVPAKFCMEQLENCLGELVLKSRMLAGYYVSGKKIVPITQLSAALGIESSDLPLLMAIASCHSPQVAAKLL